MPSCCTVVQYILLQPSLLQQLHQSLESCCSWRRAEDGSAKRGLQDSGVAWCSECKGRCEAAAGRGGGRAAAAAATVTGSTQPGSRAETVCDDD